MEKKPSAQRESKQKRSESQDIVPLKREEEWARRERKAPSSLAKYPYFDTDFDLDRWTARFLKDFGEPFWPMRPLPRIAFPRIFRGEIMVPHVDLEDRGKDFLLTAELPGFKKEDVDVQITDDAVEIRAAQDWKLDDKTKSYVHRERGSQSVQRRIRLPEEIKTGAAEANLKDGVLEVVLPKKSPKPKRRLAVK